MDSNSAAAPARDCKGKRIEWTGAGAGHFLAVIVDATDKVIAERWGTRKEIASWIEAQWPQLPTEYVPMALGAARRQVKRRKGRPSTPGRPISP